MAESFNVIIIEPNTITVNRNNEILNRAEIDKYCNIHQITNNNLMDLIVDTCEITPSDYGDTVIVHEDANNVYQLCCKADMSKFLKNKINETENTAKNENQNENNNLNANYLASYLARGNQSVDGKTVLIKSNIGENNICTLSSFTMNELYDIFNSKYIHKGIKLGVDSNAEEYEFNDNPLECMSEEEMNLYRWIEVPISKFNLIMYIQIEPLNNEINRLATRLVGNKKIFGDVIIVSKSTEHEYIDLDIDTYNKLIVVAMGPMDNRNLNDVDRDGERENGQLPIVMNRYNMLEFLYNRYNNNICHYSGEIIKSGGKICKGCYRMRYKDRESQLNDWANHFKECLHNVACINGTLTNSNNIN